MSAATTKSREAREGLSGRWKNFEIALEELQPLSKEIGRVEQLADEVTSLKLNLASAERQIASHNHVHAHVSTAFEDKARELQEEITNLKKKLDYSNSTQRQASAQEIRSLQSQLRSANKDLNRQKAELSNVTAFLAGKSQQLEDSQGEVQKMNDALGWEEPSTYV